MDEFIERVFVLTVSMAKVKTWVSSLRALS